MSRPVPCTPDRHAWRGERTPGVATACLPGGQIQRLVLHDAQGAHVRHVIATFPEQAGGRMFLRQAVARLSLTSAGAHYPTGPLHVSLGFTFRGLERLKVPSPVLGQFLARAPAFAAGASRRAAEHLGDTGLSAATRWDAAFGIDTAHALFTLHARAECELVQAEATLHELAMPQRVVLHTLNGAHIGAPEGERGQWVHFGYRDGLSQVLVRGWHEQREHLDGSMHAAGEFLLGHVNDHEFNPWLLPTAHDDVRTFFHHGSFGVLRQMEQDAFEFERWVEARAEWLARRFDVPAETGCGPAAQAAPRTPSWPDYVKAKVCGRWPDGRRLGKASGWWTVGTAPAEADFDYGGDGDGFGCPFGAHVRRMNPRASPEGRHAQAGGDVAHVRRRALIRRSRPYGPAVLPGAPADAIPRGLMGLFFCASLEDQFEHLLGQWAERTPLGTDDRGNAKDPIIGHHEDPDARFHVPLPDGQSVDLIGLRAFVRTRGTLYAFHPSLPALQLLLDNARFYDLPEPSLTP